MSKLKRPANIGTLYMLLIDEEEKEVKDENMVSTQISIFMSEICP